jgi:hypothetical protein
VSNTLRKATESKKEVDNRYQDKIASSNIKIGLNHYEDSKSSLFAKVHAFSPSYDEVTKRYTSLSGFSKEDIFIVVSLKATGDKDVIIASIRAVLDKEFKDKNYN